MAARITIVQLDPDVPLDRFGGWLVGAILRNVPAWRQPLPPPDELGDGVIVLGGRGSVDDTGWWIEPVKRLMVAAVDQDVPLLAICLGHQLLAEALGGSVRVNHPAGGEHGPVDLTWSPQAASDPVVGRVAELGGTLFPESHNDVVTKLPPGAIDLARSAAYPHQAFRVGSAVGVQFHPEASPELMTDWAHLSDGDPLTMRRRMRLADGDIFRNGSLLAHGFVAAVREYAESVPARARFVA